MALIFNFPNEILFEIASFLKYHDLQRFKLTCSHANNVGQMLLNSKETLVSAFYLFCKSQDFKWIDANDKKLLQSLNNYNYRGRKCKYRIIFFHHCANSYPFIILTRKHFLDEFQEFHTHHCQISYCSCEKILTIRYTRNSFFTPKKLTLNFRTNEKDIIDLNESTQLCGQEALLMPFNCYQQNNHHVYYLGKPNQYLYLYVLDGKQSALLMISDSTLRIINSAIKSDGCIVITIATNYYFLSLIIDFHTKMVNVCGIYQMVVDISEVRSSDCDLCVIHGLVYQYDKFRPLVILKKSETPEHFTFSFVDIN
jgi:hypothetical protein